MSRGSAPPITGCWIRAMAGRWSGFDRRAMERALELARRAGERTRPNPRVGAVIARGGKIVGEGWHRKAGGPHAEVLAVADARKRGRRVRGAVLYVTLEPCSTHGRTPPCTELIVREGLAEVVAGTVDPNPRHRGRGLRLLRRAGVRVRGGLLERECRELNPEFNRRMAREVRRGLPFRRIVSGGQTGADRAALAWAVRAGVPHGGWCPAGRRAEDGKVPPRFGLRETPSRGYSQRTRWNVRDSDGTVVFSLRAGLGGGSAFTRRTARAARKPILHLARENCDATEAAGELRRWCREHGVRVLNAAGPRASSEPGLDRWVRAVMRAVASVPRRS
jgi:pyrimidine deaminase RibD-like protein